MDLHPEQFLYCHLNIALEKACDLLFKTTFSRVSDQFVIMNNSYNYMSKIDNIKSAKSTFIYLYVPLKTLSQPSL